MTLEGQTVLVTGAGRGIGLAVATELAADGCRVALVARTATEVQAAADALNTRGGGRAQAFVADVRDAAAIANVAAAAEAALGPITLLVNNAGTAGPAGLDWEVDPDEWWECVESAVRGAYNSTRAVLPRMLERGAGRVVDMASVTGTTAWPLVSATSLAQDGDHPPRREPGGGVRRPGCDGVRAAPGHGPHPAAAELPVEPRAGGVPRHGAGRGLLAARAGRSGRGPHRRRRARRPVRPLRGRHGGPRRAHRAGVEDGSLRLRIAP